MKILYIITGLGMGGAERVVCDLADQMILRGHQVKIVYLTGESITKPKSNEIEVVYLGLNSAKDCVKASLKYRKLIAKFHPDIIHAHMVHANIFARLNRIGVDVPKLICTAHNSNEGGKLRMLAYHYTNFLSDKNTNVSNEATESLINKGAFNKHNVITVYNGVDLENFKHLTSDDCKKSNEKIFLSVGRFNQQKDYPNLLNSISIAKLDNVKYLIAGDGELRQDIEKLTHKLSLENKVSLLGKRNDIPELLNNADFFVLSSKHEGLPTVVIESMACGCFVIATDCGGTAEIMGDTGILVPPQDSQALAEAMQKAMSLRDEQIQENNIRARKRVEELFSLEKSVERWLEIYQSE
ncbi:MULTISPECIES: glycosyltransferase [unclassified Moraxella]|uniref:glycosyltransferase n=1 Tax=unclassified Moraxella TaxID=2685852 RepID=UPI003AF609ED